MVGQLRRNGERAFVVMPRGGPGLRGYADCAPGRAHEVDLPAQQRGGACELPRNGT